MGVIASQPHIEAEREGETTLELVAVRYTGYRTALAVGEHLNTQAQWPGSTSLNGGVGEEPGPWYFALVPDDGLGYLENRDDLDVIYADQREAFADALLSKRELPQNAFSRTADPSLRERVEDALGLEDPMNAGPIMAQLQDLAGVDSTDDEDEDEPDAPVVNSLMDSYDRGELGDICKALRGEASEFNLRENATKTDRAEYIATFDEDERASAISAALPDADDDDN